MGLFSRIREGLETAERLQGAGELAHVAVPGSATLELPAGRVAVALEMTEPRVGFSEDDTRHWRTPDIEIELTGPAGAVPFVPDGKVAVTDHDAERRRRSNWGAFQVPQAGSYVLTATPRRDFYAQPGIDPRVLLDAR